MLWFVRQALLKRLLAVAVVAGCGAMGWASHLLEIPAQVIEELVSGPLDPRDEPLLRLLARDPRPSVRRAVADAAPAIGATRVLRDLTSDPAPPVRETAASALARIVQGDPDRLRIVESYAASPRPGERYAAARVLAGSKDQAILAHLVRDPDPAVRRAALEAGPPREAIIDAAAYDPDRRVRRLARRMLARA
jgi:HEAT repeat protein